MTGECRLVFVFFSILFVCNLAVQLLVSQPLFSGFRKDGGRSRRCFETKIDESRGHDPLDVDWLTFVCA